MSRRTLVLSAVVVSLAVAVIAVLIAASPTSPPSSLSSSCDSLSITPKNYPFTENSFGYLCGRQAVSDGRLSITVNGRQLADGTTIDRQCPTGFQNGSSTSCSSSGMYLLVNATIQNVGSGNTSLGPTFQSNNAEPLSGTANSGPTRHSLDDIRALQSHPRTGVSSFLRARK